MMILAFSFYKLMRCYLGCQFEFLADLSHFLVMKGFQGKNVYLEESIPLTDKQFYFSVDHWDANVIEFLRVSGCLLASLGL